MGKATIIVITAIVLLSSASCINVNAIRPGPLRTESRLIELKDERNVQADIAIVNGTLDIGSGADGLLNARFIYNVDAWKPTMEYNQGYLKIEQPNPSGSITGRARNEWDLRFKNGIPFGLNVHTVSTDSTLDVTDLTLTDLSLSTTSGNARISMLNGQASLGSAKASSVSGDINLTMQGKYPDFKNLALGTTSGDADLALGGNYPSLGDMDAHTVSGDFDLDLSGDWGKDARIAVRSTSGDINIRLPRGVGAYVTTKTVSGDVNSHGLRTEGSALTNDAYGQSPVTIRIEISTVSGDIRLE